VFHGGVYSHLIYVTCSVPQGSVLGPLLFLLYTAELAELAARYGVTLHSFADDNQLYIHCRIDDVHLSVADLERCVTAIGHWMSANRLKLNTDKTERSGLAQKPGDQEQSGTNSGWRCVTDTRK